MVLNIKFQSCGMAVLCLLVLFYSRLTKIKIRTTKVFGRVLYISVCCVAADILSVVAICYADELSPLLVGAICKLYLVFLLMLVYAGYAYLCADIFSDGKKFRRMIAGSGVCFALAIAVMILLPIGYVCEDGGNTVYSYGASATAAYIIFGIFFIAMIVLLCIGGTVMHPRRRFAVGIWLAVWLVAAVVQFCNSNLLIVSFAGCIGVLLIFVMIENPELSLDKMSGFFHISAMAPYVNEMFGDGGRFFLVNTVFLSGQRAFYETVKGGAIFVGGGEVYLFFQEKDDFTAAAEAIAKNFEKQSVYICEDVLDGSFEEFLHMFKEAQQYIKKERRVNLYTVDEEIKKKLKERDATRILIKEAIEEDRIEAFYQPIYSIETGVFVSAEALARIRGRDGGLIPPWKFIPVAEEDGTIITLGKIMFEKVCLFLKELEHDTLGLKYMEVNLSVIQGEDESLAADMLTIIKKYGIGTDKINLEITESASINGREQLIENMTELIKAGIDFSLDDFGTGQSNLDYMSIMPVSIVKFDRSMTQSYFVSDKTRCIMTAAVNMIHEMGMKIVVEGIETQEQLDSMRELGADYIQGYFFSKPLPKQEFIAFLEKNNRAREGGEVSGPKG